MNDGWRETTNDGHILFFVFSLFSHPTSSGPMKGRCNCFFFFSWNFFLIWLFHPTRSSGVGSQRKRKGGEGEQRIPEHDFANILLLIFALNYFNFSIKVRRIREAQEEEWRRKLEELKQHVSIFMLIFIGFKSDHCLALSVSQKVRPHVEFCSTWICRSCYSKHRQIPSFGLLS